MSVAASRSQAFSIRQRQSRSCLVSQSSLNYFHPSFRLPEFLEQSREKSEAGQSQPMAGEPWRAR